MAWLRRLGIGGRNTSAQPAPSGTPIREVPAAPPMPRGIFAGLVVASPDQLAAFDLTGLTPPDWPAVEFKRLEPVKLGTLEAILTGVPYADIAKGDLDLIRTGGDEGPWIVAVRPTLMDALAGLTADRVAEVAAAWADTDEFKLRPTDPSGRATSPT